MIKRISIILLTVLTIQIGYSQGIDTKKLDNYFHSLETNNKFMGSVAILKEGKIVYTKQIGFADIETNKKPNKNTRYRIGSISKTFTATLIFKAIEEGKITLDQTIKSYFPTVKNSNKITISNLLNHRSGIHDIAEDEEFFEYNTQPKSQKEMIDIISKSGSDFKPNRKSDYSNSNYLLLSYILEKIYEKKYSEILNEKIITPLHLKNTYLGGKIDLGNNECYSYKYLGKWVKQTETDMSIPTGAGAIVSTPSDLLLFSEALFTNKIISENNTNKMKTLQDNYGMGLFQIPFYDKISYGHSGEIDGFISNFGYFPNEKYAFALTSNGTNYDTENISKILSNSVFDKPFEIPTFQVYELTSKELDKYLGVYTGKQIPKITITKSGKTLIAKMAKKPVFGLDATEKDIFTLGTAGIVLEFDPIKNEMTLKHDGNNYKLTKE